jgi:hypothetical protein
VGHADGVHGRSILRVDPTYTRALRQRRVAFRRWGPETHSRTQSTSLTLKFKMVIENNAPVLQLVPTTGKVTPQNTFTSIGLECSG